MNAREIAYDDVWPTMQQPVLLAFDNTTRKRLIFLPSERRYYVRDSNDIQYVGEDLSDAIDSYNGR